MAAVHDQVYRFFALLGVVEVGWQAHKTVRGFRLRNDDGKGTIERVVTLSSLRRGETPRQGGGSHETRAKVGS